MSISRRRFLRSVAAAGTGLAFGDPAARAAQARGEHPLILPPDRAAPVSPADTFADLPRHFIFEYYPWYSASPYQHWNQDGHTPPVDIASNYMPALGAYDSASTKVMEQHARWIAGAGVGAINVSWWGRDSDIDRLVPSLMDVMAAHDIQVTFHIEPYTDQHALSYADDIRYLITKYGDGRRWDCFLLLQDASGESGPVFKSFRTIVTPTFTDCHGITSAVSDYASDAIWRQQTDRVRETFRSEFDHVTMLADTVDAIRTASGGFDGIAVYDNFVTPDTWRNHAQDCTHRKILFSFNINAGFDAVITRQLPPGTCYTPPPFAPGGGSYDWTRAADREAAANAVRDRITQSFHTTIAVQTAPRLLDAQRGFFLVYINSFNEWHEGDAFEPMKNAADLTPAERAVGYHNPTVGSYRLDLLTELIGSL